MNNAEMLKLSFISRNIFKISKNLTKMNRNQPSSSFEEFREVYKSANHVVVLTGAGISAESGIPTFRGSGGYWRTFSSENLATLDAFTNNPSLVWEFYSYRRELVLQKEPNEAHHTLVKCEKQLKELGKKFVVITQNVDELHRTAGTGNLIELHGSLFKTKCMKCKSVKVNRDSPICAALKDKGSPKEHAEDARIPIENLPKCQSTECNGLLRPGVVWFGEGLETDVLQKAESHFNSCDLCLIVGTSSVVYPAAMFAPQLADRGIPVAEFNLEYTPVTEKFDFHFQGPCSQTLTKIFND